MILGIKTPQKPCRNIPTVDRIIMDKKQIEDIFTGLNLSRILPAKKLRITTKKEGEDIVIVAKNLDKSLIC